MSEQVIIYTDGACRGNPGIGGWGVWINDQGQEKKLSGYHLQTTNNRMELTAVIKALSALEPTIDRVLLYTDSKYVIDGITQWIHRWQQQNWRTASKKPVKNVDLWKTLFTLQQQYAIDWHWVKGHSNNPGNELVDRLANQAIDDYYNQQVKNNR